MKELPNMRPFLKKGREDHWHWWNGITREYEAQRWLMKEITFREFRKLMMKQGRTVDDLVDLFRGQLDDSRDFFERVMSCQWRNPETRRYEDRGDVVIPYRCVIEFYLKGQVYFEDSKAWRKKAREYRKRVFLNATEWAKQLCACGCGQPVFDRQKYFNNSCRQKAYRTRSLTNESVTPGPNEIE